MANFRQRLLGTSVLVGVGVLSTPVQAQDTTQPADPAASQPSGPVEGQPTPSVSSEGENVQGVILRAFPDGRRERIEYTANYDREYPVTGTEDYDHVVLKRIDRYTSEAVLSHAGRVFGTARRVIASDGKSMTITFRRDSESGVSVLNFAFYERLPDAEPQ